MEEETVPMRQSSQKTLNFFEKADTNYQAGRHGKKIGGGVVKGKGGQIRVTMEENLILGGGQTMQYTG